MVVYIKNNCPQCHATMRWLKSHDISFKSINISEQPEYIKDLKSKSVRQTPYVETESDHWSGFRPERLAKLL